MASSINITLALTKRAGPPSISPSPSTAESEDKLKSRNRFEKFVSWLEDLPSIRLIVVFGAMIAIPAALITIMIFFAGSKRTLYMVSINKARIREIEESITNP